LPTDVVLGGPTLLGGFYHAGGGAYSGGMAGPS
jgi:hypothetical protein